MHKSKTFDRVLVLKHSRIFQVIIYIFQKHILMVDVTWHQEALHTMFTAKIY